MARARLILWVDYDEKKTNLNKLVEAFAQVLETSLSTAELLDGEGNPELIDVEYDEEFADKERSRASTSQPPEGS